MRGLIVAVFFSLFLYVSGACADTSVLLNDTLYQDKTHVVTQQIELLRDRLSQAQNELTKLQRQRDNPRTVLAIDHVDKNYLNQTGAEIGVARSDLDSINIEISESQQTVARLEKDVQEVENQFNVYSMFGLKLMRDDVPDLSGLQRELRYQKNLLALEKNRADYLDQLQTTLNSILQFHKAKYARIEALLKSQTIMQLKEQQAKSEINFQQQQSYWLQQLNRLYAQLNQLEQQKKLDKVAYARLENEIFYANENVNFTYSKMLIARYQDQLQQLRVSISRSTSITLLDKVMEQTQLLGKQLARMSELLDGRIAVLEKRKAFLSHAKNNQLENGLVNLDNQYKAATKNVTELNQQLLGFRTVLDKTLQQELSARQGLPGFGAKAWLDLGAELLLVPSLTFQVVKNLSYSVLKAINAVSFGKWCLLFALELIWIAAFYGLNYFLKRLVTNFPDHEFGHINLKWLLIKLLHRCLISIAVLGNIFCLFLFLKIRAPSYSFLINFALVWVFFKVMNTAARLCLVETVHDQAGHDVRLYHRLKWAFLVGGVITALTVFIHQLPLIYEVKDLFDRLFLSFLLIVSIFLLKSWEVLPGLILPHVDDRHAYVKRVVRLLGLSIPLILLVNSALGLFGFVNFVLTISWYESVFLCVLVGYLFLRGLLNDVMDFVSQLFIRHVANGWLWTEAFLKPIDKVLRAVLFFTSWAFLFVLYGWDLQSPVVKSLNKILHYHLVDMLNTSITLLSLLELFVIVSVLSWGVRWIREFVYRLLLSRTKDLGVRNSIAILSQYTLILVGVFICLRVLGIDFRALTVVAGAFAFGVGLGLRDLVNNFACGFLLLLERPIRVGDTVTINNYEGEVVHIGGRAVTVRTWDHMDVIVPNAEIFSKSFMNWTAKDCVVRTVINIKIGRHDRPQDVQAVIYQVLAAHKDVLTDPPTEVFLKELTDGMIEFEVRYFVNLRHVKSRVSVRSEVLVAIWEAFEQHGIQPPYPHHEVFVKTGMPMIMESVNQI